jgi:hypothetical protein
MWKLKIKATWSTLGYNPIMMLFLCKRLYCYSVKLNMFFSLYVSVLTIDEIKLILVVVIIPPAKGGKVERYNRILMDAVRCFIGKSQNQWDLRIQQIAGALRASLNRMTGFTANMLMLGREVHIPAYLMFPQKLNEAQLPQDYSEELGRKMKAAHELAHLKTKSSSNRMKRNYDLRLLERNYEVGDKVYLLETAVLKGKCKKLCPPWKGPGIIVSKLFAYIFRVKLRNAIMVVNHDRLNKGAIVTKYARLRKSFRWRWGHYG